MSVKLVKGCIVIAFALLCCSCGHTKVSRVALLSYGDMEGRILPKKVEGPILTGKDNETFLFCPFSFLSKATANALEGTEYDTLVNVDVTTRTGLFVWANAIEVKGTGVNSKTLPKEGGAQ